MPINSKDKGKRFERYIANYFKEHGFSTHRTNQYCGNTGDASDVEGLPLVHVECKHQETMHLYDWMEQAERDSKGNGRTPVVFHKKNNAEVLVTMRLDDWTNLYIKAIKTE